MAFNPVSYKYTAEISFINYTTNEFLDYGNCLTSLAIKKDYKNNIFPLYVLGLSLSHEQKTYLATHKFYVSLKFYRCPVDSTTNSEETEDTDDPITDKILYSTILRPFDPEANVAQITEIESEDTGESTREGVLESYTLTCIPREELQINNSIINEVYADANINEIIINLVSNVYTKTFEFQESMNTERYSSLMIPPMSLIPALRYLQDNYMIYKNKLNMFFESNKLYMYDILDSTRSFKNNLLFEICKNDDTNQTKFQNVYMDDKNDIKKYLNQNLPFVKQTDIYRYSTGEQVTYSSYDENFNLINRSYDTNDTNNANADKKIRYIWNNDVKQIFENPIKNNLSIMTSAMLSNVDPTLINPLTKVSISGCENSEFNGEYVLVGSEEFYSSSDKKTFTGTIMMSLLKI